MSNKLIDLTGQRFGRLFVIQRDGSTVNRDGQHRPTWLCQCDCGNTAIVLGHNLRGGKTRSCGCLRIEKSRENGLARLGRKKGECSR